MSNGEYEMPDPTTRPEDDPYSVGREERLPAQAGGGEKPASISIHARYGRLFNDGAYTQPGWWVPHEDYERLRRHWEDACKQIRRTV
jgi:hypothetical protein